MPSNMSTAEQEVILPRFIPRTDVDYNHSNKRKQQHLVPLGGKLENGIASTDYVSTWQMKQVPAGASASHQGDEF